MSPQVAIAVVGLGNVGRALLPQLRAQSGDSLRLVAACTSRRMCLDAGGLEGDDLPARLAERGEPTDLGRLSRALAAHPAPRRVIIDLTASAQVAASHVRWLSRGLDVVTANKIAAAGTTSVHRDLRQAATLGRTRYLASATVGAGLPVLRVLERLHAAGDSVRAIRGILSGSMTHILLRMEAGLPFSAALREAHAQGLTEPDPRLDLGGEDVARKLVIAGRAAGISTDSGSIDCRGPVPAELATLAVPDFLAASSALDAPFADLLRAARQTGGVLRHVGSLTADGHGTVGILSLPADDPLAQVRPRDNCIEIESTRYGRNPLLIRGAGAGPEVTASAVLADLLEVGAQA